MTKPTDRSSGERGERRRGAKSTPSALPAPPLVPVSSELEAMTAISSEERRALIAQAAYFRAERRGFQPGHEAEDWSAAEQEVDRTLRQASMRNRG
jgi:hypothetical protein